MSGIYTWIWNITAYLILTTMISHLLADSKYEKYLRLFRGMVLILIVIQPFTRALHLESLIEEQFFEFTFQEDARELEGKWSGIENTRREQILKQYKNEIEQDIAQMVSCDGWKLVSVRVIMEEKQNAADFGALRQIVIHLYKGTQGNEGEAVETVKIEKIQLDAEKENVEVLKRRIAEYYGLEEAHVEIRLENG